MSIEDNCGKCGEKLERITVMSPDLDKSKRYKCVKCGVEDMTELKTLKDIGFEHWDSALGSLMSSEDLKEEAIKHIKALEDECEIHSMTLPTNVVCNCNAKIIQWIIKFFGVMEEYSEEDLQDGHE